MPSLRKLEFFLVSRRLLLIVWPFLLIVALLVLLGNFSMSMLSAVRAYVGGESLWSKAQKASVESLSRYARTHDEADYRRYLGLIAVPLGDRDARLELEKASPDLGVAQRGFLQGRNAPDDVAGLIRLFRWFRHDDGLDQAIAIWTEGDRDIADLVVQATQLHAVINGGADATHQVPLILERIHFIDDKLTPLEESFSATLGRASRQTERRLALVTEIAAATLILLGLFLSRRVLRQREAFEEALRISEERHALAVEGANDGIWDWDIVARKIFYSRRVRDMLGHDERVLGEDPADIERVILPEDYPAACAAIYRHWQERDTSVLHHTMRMRTRHGDVRWILARSKVLYAADGTPLRMAGSYTDVTERTRNEQELRLAASVFEASHAGILIAGRDRRIVSANHAFVGLSGYGLAELIGRPVGDLRSARITRAFDIKVWRDVHRKGLWRGELVGRKKGGIDYPFEVSVVRVPDPGGRTAFYIYTCVDISDRKYAEARIHHLAYFDPLTGLPNRTYLTAHFDAIIGAARAAGEQLAVVFLDLDGFKEVNDTLGHTAGDLMIKQHARRLRAGMSEASLLCRFGGDEFVMLLPRVNRSQAVREAREIIARIDQPLSIEGRDIRVTASAGVSIFPDDAADAESLVREADVALYRAKERGKNTVVAFSADMDLSNSRRFDLLNALRVALDQNQFALRFQPIMNTDSGRVAGIEALVYWNHPHLGTIGPSTFIALAEESGLIEALGEWVLEEALRHYQAWREAGLPPLYLSVNVSAMQLRKPQVMQDVILEAMRSGVIAPGNLVLEMTERQIVRDLKNSLPVLQILAARGVGLAIDDFGTGYANFGYLRDLPVSQIKIDMSFIRNLAVDAGDRAIVKAIIGLGRSLHLDVVAEGVETTAQLEILRQDGCTAVQGFLFARPLPAEAIVAFILHRESGPSFTQIEVDA
jgi:diguanylate cyclase (GGDEF)-like protein/PAS domain S-box-containing protein